MCGRYALSLRSSVIRQRMADQDMYAEEAPEDDDERVRQTYNFAPGYHGLIYRAATSDRGSEEQADREEHEQSEEPARKRQKTSKATTHHSDSGKSTYKLQAAKWGLIPFWTKRPPDYGSQLKTINCRDDSLIENRGMWNTMKQKKRCIVIAEGFYEWLKKDNGKQKIPHYMKRKDGQLLCLAGLWDMVQYEGSDEKLYTYTIITTDSNSQLKFLHDRMPVILEPGSDAMKTWLDPKNDSWSKDLQSLLKPYAGELDCYPVDQGVGKVGNNSPLFVVPVDSKENKKNIANFFGNQAKKESPKIKKDPDEDRKTTSKVESTEDNAPLPKPENESDQNIQEAVKEDPSHQDIPEALKGALKDDPTLEEDIKAELDETSVNLQSLPPTDVKKESATPSPVKKSKPMSQGSIRKTRNATTNMTVAKAPDKEGNAKITSFFKA